ncbi:ABC transporter [Hyphomicrobium nitrativorans NL23]|uniref:ABC transporter n=1 Tax=Hyphomicrobium nitrativorans NL23 TaxID=1029756 RepID=V5SE90_9HYPH|nr:NHLP family bacteriocin export ABC transporter peptidase/permease/ATPase subunit [Hyphomicrobium nitrativorans]AHB48365.1 ABC transporter [Hyphomicrobium nitrativorans NL23]
MISEPLPKLPNIRVKTPTFLQMETVECGAAALGIVLAHFGKWRPLEELRAECGVSRDGCTARNILHGARRYGLAAKGRKASLASALSGPFPYIAFWNFNHFLVVEGHRNGTVYLNDPATGPRTVTLSEFDDAFTGVMLVFETTDDFVPEGGKPGLFARLTPRTRGIRNAIALSVLISLTTIVPGLVIPGFSKIFIDDYLIQGNHDWLRPLLAGMAATTLLLAGLTWLSHAVLLRMETKLALVDSARFVWHLLRLPLTFFSQRHPGDIVDRIAANDRIAGAVAGRLGESLVNAVTVVFYAAVMIFLDALLAAITIALSLFNIGVFRVLSRYRMDASARLQQDFGQFQAASVTGIRAIETLKASGTDDDYFERWAGFQAKTLNNNRRLALHGVLADGLAPLLDGLAIAAVIGIGGYRIIHGDMTVGTLVAFQALAMSFTGPINALVSAGGAFQELSADLSRSDDVFNYGRDSRYAREAERGGKLERLSGDIVLKDLTFGYNPLEAPLIKDFNLTVRAGQRVALVGGSGSGKSTIANLVGGLYRPWSGDVLFDGVALSEIPVSTMTGSIAVVSQQVFLFSGKVRDNLSAWDTTVPDADMIAALRDAQIFDIVAARGGALDAAIEEGGANLSGGEAQRIEIARALTSRPSILVLDEATSALDPVTEKAIDAAIRRRGCTCLIIAHRLSTVRDADEIVVLDRGEVVERGTHDDLMRANGTYARLVAQE